MTIQKIPLASLQKIRTYLTQTLILPESEDRPQALSVEAADDLPEPESIDELSGLFNLGGDEQESELITQSPDRLWFISTVNPAAPLRKLPGLHLKPGLRLVSYVYRYLGKPEPEGIGVTWAVPEEFGSTAELEAALAGCETQDTLPHPQGALEHFMLAVDGDRTPASFLCASLLRRHIEDFLQPKDARQWSHHRLIDSLPRQAIWQGKTQIKDYVPKVRMLGDRQVAVEYFTCRTTSPVAIFRHREQYPPSSYYGQAIDRAVAVPTNPK